MRGPVRCPLGAKKLSSQSYYLSFESRCNAIAGYYRDGEDFLLCPVSTYKPGYCSERAHPVGNYVNFTGATACSTPESAASDAPRPA